MFDLLVVAALAASPSPGPVRHVQHQNTLTRKGLRALDADIKNIGARQRAMDARARALKKHSAALKLQLESLSKKIDAAKRRAKPSPTPH
jgi:hypothetical protein